MLVIFSANSEVWTINITYLNLQSHSKQWRFSLSAHLKMFGKTNTFNAWQEYIQTITNCKRRTKQERKRKMLSKENMIQPNQPKIKETLVRRKSINSGKPNFSDNEGRFENAAVHFIKLATYSSFLDYTMNVLYLLKQH